MDTSRPRRAATAGALTAAALFAATACNSTTGYTAPAFQAPQVPPGAVTPTAGGGLSTTKNATLGTVVTDGAGLTLYRYGKDKNIPPTSNCINACATTWPPADAVSDTQVKGVDQNLVGSAQRPDGTKQLTIGGWPMYHYSGDKTAGEANGQKKGGVWYASAPDGSKAGASPTGAGTTPSGAGGAGATGTTGSAGTVGTADGGGTTTENSAADPTTTTNSYNSDYRF
jgi:predicted lipoprotein with Yx(FWY)xxD motif